MASSYLQYKTIEALVEAGASIDCCDGRGLKCIDVVGENITEFDDQDATNEWV